MRWTPVAALALATLAPASVVFAQDADGDGVPNASDAYPCDPTASATAYAPADGVFGSVAFEDQWPARGDLDFNDVVVGYNYTFRLDPQGRVVSLALAIDPMAVGGNDDNGLGLHLPIARTAVSRITRTIGSNAPENLVLSTADAELTAVLSNSLRADLFAGVTGPINSRPTVARRQGTMLLVEVVFTAPQVLTTGAAPYDLYIFHTNDPRHQLHLPTFAGTANMNTALFGTVEDGSTGARHFVDTAGLPFALVFPTAVEYPMEAIPVSQLYPRIVGFASSAGATDRDFYTRDVAAPAAFRDLDGLPAPRLSVPPRTTWSTNIVCSAVAVISGNVVDNQGSGNSLALLRATGETYDQYGTGAQPLQSLYDDLDHYGVIIIPDHQGRDSTMVSTMSAATNRSRLVDWVRRGGVLYLGVYDDGGGTTAIFNPPGFAVSGADDRTDQPILNDRAFLHFPHELADNIRMTDSWERVSTFPTEATQAQAILGNNTAVDFRMGNGYVLFQGAPLWTRYGSSWPGMHEVYGTGTEYYRNVIRYLLDRAGMGVAATAPGGSAATAGTSCRTLRTSGATTDTVYWIDPDGAGGNAPFLAYCDMTRDGGGWTLVARVADGSTSAHRSAAAVASVMSPRQLGTGKLADAVINRLRGGSNVSSVIRMQVEAGQIDYFRDARDFVALGTTSSINTVYDTWADALTQSRPCSGQYNGSYHTGLVGWLCYDQMLFADNPGFRAGATYQGGTVWVRDL